MGNPNIAELGKKTRLPINRKDHTQKHPNGYLVPRLKRFLNKKITYEDPETQKMITGKVGDAIIWRLLLNACQGENEAIKEILNRIDGKNPDFIFDQSKHTYFQFEYKKLNENNIRTSRSPDAGLGISGSVESVGSGQKVRKDATRNPRVNEEGIKPTKS